MTALAAAAIAFALVAFAAAFYWQRRLESALNAHAATGRDWLATLSDLNGRVDRISEEVDERDRRIAFLELELEAANRPSSLVGQTVAANTRKPDDQTLHGVVREELPDGALLLAGAILLEPVPVAGGGTTIRRTRVGDVRVRDVSWVQIGAELPAREE